MVDHDHETAGAHKDSDPGAGGQGQEGRRTRSCWTKAKRSGYVRVIADGNQYDLSEEISLEKNNKHNIEIVVDRLVVREGIEKRLTDSIENGAASDRRTSDGGCDRTGSP